MLMSCRLVLKSRLATVSHPLLSVSHLNKSGSNWSTHQLLICVVVASPKRGSLLPEFEDETFSLDPYLSKKALSQNEEFVNGPEKEDPYISKHYLVGKYGAKLREIWAALATVTAYKHKAANAANTTTATVPVTPPRKRPRRSIPAPTYTYDDSEGSGTSREGSTISEFMVQVASADLPSEDSVVLLIIRVLNLISYCTQLFGSQQPTIPVLTPTDLGQAARVDKLSRGIWNKWHHF
ncbi:uncharacterized protein FPRN_11990 [Fusarium proliferatum]|nr:uncharacterized protein FPRN_11990 [Fusarium proliferatum]